MLVLTRMHGQSVMIGNDISLTVLEVRRGQVRIGVAAPREVQVDRGEIRDRKVRTQRGQGDPGL